jgi:hypothetical protein
MDNYPQDSYQFPPDHPESRNRPDHPAGHDRPHPHSFSLKSVFGPPELNQNHAALSEGPSSVTPQPVVQVLSPRGIEYVFLTIVLFTGAINLIAALIILIDGNIDFSALAFPTAALVVTVPIFAWLFLRLKRAELRNPKLALDPSKRRSTQFTKVISFATCLFTLIGFVFGIFIRIGGNSDASMVKLFFDVLVILAVAGGILAYYWINER